MPRVIFSLHPPQPTPSMHCTPSPNPTPSTLALTHMPFLFSRLRPGLEQLRKLRHLDVAYNLLEEHRALSPLCLLAELRKVRLGRFKDLEASLAPLPPPGADVLRAFLPQGGSHPPLSPSCPSALPGGKPVVVPPCTPSGHRPVLVTPGQGCCFWCE